MRARDLVLILLPFLRLLIGGAMAILGILFITLRARNKTVRELT